MSGSKTSRHSDTRLPRKPYDRVPRPDSRLFIKEIETPPGVEETYFRAHHGVFIEKTPTAAGNVIQASATGFVPFTVKLYVGATANLTEWQKDTGQVAAKVDYLGKITGFGLDATNQKITQVGTPTGTSDAATKGYSDTTVCGTLVNLTGGWGNDGNELIYRPGVATARRLKVDASDFTITGAGNYDVLTVSSSITGAFVKLAPEAGDNYIIPDAADAEGLIIKEAVSQSVPVFEVRDASNTSRVIVDYADGEGSGVVRIAPDKDIESLVILGGTGGQTSNIFEVWPYIGASRELTFSIDGAGVVKAKKGANFGTGGDQIVTGIATPVATNDATNKSYVDGKTWDHGTKITGLGDDDHTQYIHNSPGTSTRNRITQPAATTIPFRIQTHGSTSVDSFLIEDSIGNPRVYVDKDFKLWCVLGIDGGTQELTNIGEPTDPASGIPLSYMTSTASGKGASKVGIQDAGGYTSQTAVEGALQELYGAALDDTFTFEPQMLGARLIRDPGSGTMGLGDRSVDSATDYDGFTPLLNFPDGALWGVAWYFVPPDELDLTQAVTAEAYFRNSTSAGAGNFEIELTARAVSSDESESSVSGGALFGPTGVIKANPANSGRYFKVTWTGFFGTSTLSYGDVVKGVVYRDATAGNTDDTATAIAQFIHLRFVGKRKKKSF